MLPNPRLAGNLSSDVPRGFISQQPVLDLLSLRTFHKHLTITRFSFTFSFTVHWRSSWLTGVADATAPGDAMSKPSVSITVVELAGVDVLALSGCISGSDRMSTSAVPQAETSPQYMNRHRASARC